MWSENEDDKRMKPLHVAEQNKPYYSADYVKGFNDGAKDQYEADKKETKRNGRWIYNTNFAEPPFKCSACGKSQGRLSNYCPECGAKMEATNAFYGKEKI